ncbi:unnamed protein product [Symbiodinium microadriaticum]|nr:unnamed protein product [Symbiodinium microadriaticum]
MFGPWAGRGFSGLPGTISCNGFEHPVGGQSRHILGASLGNTGVGTAVPQGASNITMRFTMDSRYRPELYGGNSCRCTRGSWDHSAEPGVWVLWSAAGRSGRLAIWEYLTSGPHRALGEAFDAGEMTQILQPPPELNLQAGEHPVIAFMTFSQYPAYGEIVRDSSGRCSVDWSDEGEHTFKDKPFMVVDAELIYRQALALPGAPPASHPRLFGSDGAWMSQRVRPFLEAPCEPLAQGGVGWFEDAGVADVKGHFELSARGFRSCHEASKDGGDIASYGPAGKYLEFDGSSMPSYTDGLKVLHLLRRQWACADSGSGSFESCEYNGTETERLAQALLQVDRVRFNTTTWTCGVSCGAASGETIFDLTTAEPVSYFSTWYDVLVSRSGLLDAVDVSRVSVALKEQMGLFVSAFNTGHWSLWNGNNWTPHLCIAAMAWAVSFWHEENEMAREVVAMINDILWLHRSMFTADGVYVEGVAMYSFMSVTGLIGISTLQKASFGSAPEAVDEDALTRLVDFHLASMSTDAYTVAFGDSHRKRGWGDFSTLQSALAPKIVRDSEQTEALTPCGAREYCAALYGSGGLYEDPWRISPELLSLNLTDLVLQCSVSASQPLGAQTVRVFRDGGYASIRTPLLAAESSLPCFGSGQTEICVKRSPSLADNIPYSFLAVQVDFGTFIWTAWGTSLISEYGYGTIATAVGPWDTRRYEYIDNNPAGHNTLVVREAFKDPEERINFSQLHLSAGSLVSSATRVDSGEGECLELDGSVPYGASRTDGWLDVMRRYVCPMSDGAFVLIDLFAVKRNRTSLNIYGAQYGGPNFDEAEPASRRLHIEEYFHTETSAPLATDSDGNRLAEELEFDRDSDPNAFKWCSHVDPVVLDAGSVALYAKCGLGGFRPADGWGFIRGFSVSGGHFVYDGLVTTVDTWKRPNWLKKRRFRFVGNSTVGDEGDVRLFVLSPVAASQTETPTIALESCADELGCPPNASKLECFCISMCANSVVRWGVLLLGRLHSFTRVGTCTDGSVAHSLRPEEVSALQSATLAALGSSSRDPTATTSEASTTSNVSLTSTSTAMTSTTDSASASDAAGLVGGANLHSYHIFTCLLLQCIDTIATLQALWPPYARRKTGMEAGMAVEQRNWGYCRFEQPENYLSSAFAQSIRTCGQGTSEPGRESYVDELIRILQRGHAEPVTNCALGRCKQMGALPFALLLLHCVS